MNELKPENVRELLRECVTVVQPGEILVLNFPHLSMAGLDEVRERLRAWNAENGTDLKVLIMSGDVELGVAPDRPEEVRKITQTLSADEAEALRARGVIDEDGKLPGDRYAEYFEAHRGPIGK